MPARSGGRRRRRATVVVVLGVPVTILAAGATGRRAGLDRYAEDANLGRGLAGDDAARSCAGIGAIEVKANAADHSCTSSSPRQESAQLVQVAAQSTHSSMQRTRLSRSGPGRCGCA